MSQIIQKAKSSMLQILACPSREASGSLGLSALVITISLESVHLESEIGDKAKYVHAGWASAICE